MPWLSLRYESNDLTDQDDMAGANEYLGRVQDAIASELACSNFYPEHRMATKDKYVSACSAILVTNDPDRNICCFNTLAPWDYWIDTDQYGEVDTLFYKKTMSLDKAYEMFGEKCPQWIQDAVHDGDSYNIYHDFLLCIYPRKKIYTAARSIFPKEKKFAVVWMYLASGMSTTTAQSEIIDESGTDFFPAIVGTWDRDGDNPYGTSPVIRNIAELKRLDALSYETMLSVQKINHPAYAGVASSLEGFSDDPGARNKVNSMDMIPVVVGSQQTVDGALTLQQMQEQAVQKMFNNDMFNYFGREENNKAYTATQVNAVKAEQLSLLSAVYGNFQKEIEKTIKLVIAIMAENKRLPKGALKLVSKKSGNGKIRVVIDSTMAQELRAYTNRDANIALLEQASVLLQIAPDSLMNYDFDEIARGIAIGMGVKHTVLRDKMVVEQEKEYQAQVQQAQMMQQAELTQSEIDRNESGATNLNNAGGSNQYRRA